MNEYEDFKNPYFYLAATPSILLSFVPGGTEGKLGTIVAETLIKKETIEESSVFLKGNNKLINELIQDIGLGYIDGNAWTSFLESLGLHPT